MQKIDWGDFALDVGIALGINTVFMALVALVCWPLGQLGLVGRWLQGYAGLWAAMMVAMIIMRFVAVRWRSNAYDHYAAYVVINAAMSGLLLLAFVIYIAASVQKAAGDAGVGVGVVLVVLGLLASYVGQVVVTTFYKGQVYALLNLVISLVGYVLSFLLLVVLSVLQAY